MMAQFLQRQKDCKFKAIQGNIDLFKKKKEKGRFLWMWLRYCKKRCQPRIPDKGKEGGSSFSDLCPLAWW